MNPQDVWIEFTRDRDIAKAGRRILSLAKGLRADIIRYLSSGRREARKPHNLRKLRKDAIIEVRSWRMPRRYPLRSELITALRWVRGKLREAAESINISMVTKWNLIEEIRSVKERLLSFRSRGRRVVSLYELVISREEIVPALVSLLFMERDGEVELLQDKPFDDIYVVLRRG